VKNSFFAVCFTNAAVVDDDIKFVSGKSSSLEPRIRKEKHKVDDAVTVDKKCDNNNSIQGSEEEDKQQQPTTNNNNNSKHSLLTYYRTSHSGSGNHYRIML
jgi:hypothetical protein